MKKIETYIIEKLKINKKSRYNTKIDDILYDIESYLDGEVLYEGDNYKFNVLYDIYNSDVIQIKFIKDISLNLFHSIKDDLKNKALKKYDEKYILNDNDYNVIEIHLPY